MRSAARVLGTARVRTSSSMLTARTPWIQRPHVLGASWDRRAVLPCSQISAAVTPRSYLSTGASTGVEKNSNRGYRGSRQPAVGVGLAFRGSSPSRPWRRRGIPNVAPGFPGNKGGAVARGIGPRCDCFADGRTLNRSPDNGPSPRVPRAVLREEAMRETHVSAEQPEAQEAPRLQVPHAFPRGSGGAQGPAPAWPYAPLGLIWRVR